MVQMLHTPEQAVAWLRARQVTHLQTDSRKVAVGEAFIAWPGAVQDGRQFVADAVQRGAIACLVEAQGMEAFTLNGEEVACYAGLKRDTGEIAAQFYGNPSHQLPVVAVTGTNGKTSTAWWLAQALSALPGSQARPSGVIGTLGVGAVPAPQAADPLAAIQSTGLTTPDPVTLQQTLRSFVDQGFKACAMEASSIGLDEQRMGGTQIAVAVFTNFTQDHLDYHGDMDAYWQSKRKLFDWPGLRSAVVNIDDSRGAQLAAELANAPLDLWTVAIEREARLRASGVRVMETGMAFDVREGDRKCTLQTPLIGLYNVSNLLGVLAAMRALGVELEAAVQVCASLQPVPGRLERLGGVDAPLVAVDYAHTPDALAQVLTALRPVAQARQGKLWCVFGCGGDRDPSKRPLMGAIAARAADRVVVTSDNPRSEKPEAIVAQVLLGVADREHVDVEVDRGDAIGMAIARAEPGDVVLLAGKGHEPYQEIAGVKRPFSDRAQAQAALQARSAVFEAVDVHHMLPGSTLLGNRSAKACRVHTDTRSITQGDLFVALQGERFDANTMLAQAAQAGATVLVYRVGADTTAVPADVACIGVDDTREALRTLARAWRARQSQVRLIGVTGSNGKTTVTQMIAAILRAHAGSSSLATEGNFNNDIGVPLTVLRLRANHRVAVVEMGMNHPGEIAVLAAVAQPDVVLVNNAQREHLEFMHTVEAVARENGSAISALPAAGVAVFPADDPFTPIWMALAQQRRSLRFSAATGQGGAEVVLESAEWQDGAWDWQARLQGQPVRARLQIAGRHNALNAAAAAACAHALGVPVTTIASGLSAFVPVKGRSRALSLALGGQSRTVIDDTYNANPDSVRAAIDVLAELPSPRLLVLGDMGEVGQDGPAFHAEVAAHARARGVEQLFLMGELARHGCEPFPGARHFEHVDALIEAVLTQAGASRTILIKGSRFMRMERVVQALQAAAAPKEETQP
ncbi:bifunctional UDP-N-acetylmuramoyl-L-alanyl-D-glutamate--2,6-diaminopimelate ligase MurE/UDP-N-acetylmuramoyl-tripeptide--D-alanyl-D-alanine ligase MurF [Curvibacter sp. APW13]|uniref:bifunctional UDP-N-acetylmuramoyl-L-alanyl-D-glutamate--2, 6-diaminopimelate ligase MurE/UDP-N-acetylmuramoyl-tripeptide--D-alanyl-D-alanine ligase MurF n=1 Tax=Curvibacter sp. APW13 TaxID=3077236 RepID=UPI0028DFF0AA|nr:bifunctional UDP-N-acetylmuramoyl-L-alanyl-D-glutamate--2,6-diaminopimelate ligase MurE/UDP-N-acetylmuramoyl-tripeptide--D-alanyl-D-alanine ligase MurF [Curvibacter sp. APW13]MDT8989802.1 bifunctional UDP-N-acetylmuramoyl-L-alanyl-D-glutamate--2,6-diaminopimelate ligase MurE/UDP-N-acetylmuramoyl-tripeptide--D-alanyl-D-alanine ligase MurF [Curvibacter sp. APW13]